MGGWRVAPQRLESGLAGLGNGLRGDDAQNADAAPVAGSLSSRAAIVTRECANSVGRGLGKRRRVVAPRRGEAGIAFARRVGRGRYGGGEWRGTPEAETGLPEAQLPGERSEGAAGLGKFGQTSRPSPGRTLGFAGADGTPSVLVLSRRGRRRRRLPAPPTVGRGGRS